MWWVIILALIGVGIKSHVRDHIAADRYIKLTEMRRRTIRKFCHEHMSDNDWSHLASVLKHCGFKSKDNNKLSVEQVKSEHAEMVLLDLELDTKPYLK